MRKNCSSDQEKLLKFKAEGQGFAKLKLLKFKAEDQGFAKFLRSLEQFIQTVKDQNNFW